MRTLDAWSAARQLREAGNELSEATYALYWLSSMGFEAGGPATNLARHITIVRDALAALEAAMAEPTAPTEQIEQLMGAA